ncbi:MAG TPA: hypothetical protein PKO33_13795, partial [Pyrinomonadaceae bacterium]|nr:hypothetical protein [Pyrinomonadaceae bacterium]
PIAPSAEPERGPVLVRGFEFKPRAQTQTSIEETKQAQAENADRIDVGPALAPYAENWIVKTPEQMLAEPTHLRDVLAVTQERPEALDRRLDDLGQQVLDLRKRLAATKTKPERAALQKQLTDRQKEIDTLDGAFMDAQESFMSRLFDGVVKRAESRGIRIEDPDYFGEYVMPYLTDGRYMEGYYNRRTLPEMVDELLADYADETGQTLQDATGQQTDIPADAAPVVAKQSPQGYVNGRPVAVAEHSDPKKRTVTYLDEKGGTAEVVAGRVKRNLPAVAMTPYRIETTPAVVGMAKKRRNVRALKDAGFEFEITGRNRIRITARPGNISEGTAESEFLNVLTESEGARISALPERRNVPDATKHGLAVWVQRRGGIAPDRTDARKKRGMSGELRYLTRKEGGIPGLVNKKSEYNAEQMAQSAFDAGFFPEYGNDLAEFQRNVPPDEFLRILRDDPKRISIHNVLYERSSADALAEGPDAFAADDRVFPILEKGVFDENDVTLLKEIADEYGIQEVDFKYVIAAWTREAPGAGAAGRTGSETGTADAPDARNSASLRERADEELAAELGDAYEGDLTDDADLSFDFTDDEP